MMHDDHDVICDFLLIQSYIYLHDVIKDAEDMPGGPPSLFRMVPLGCEE